VRLITKLVIESKKTLRSNPSVNIVVARVSIERRLMRCVHFGRNIKEPRLTNAVKPKISPKDASDTPIEVAYVPLKKVSIEAARDERNANSYRAPLMCRLNKSPW
jgi:hypothetical protein